MCKPDGREARKCWEGPAPQILSQIVARVKEHQEAVHEEKKQEVDFFGEEKRIISHFWQGRKSALRRGEASKSFDGKESVFPNLAV